MHSVLSPEISHLRTYMIFMLKTWSFGKKNAIKRPILKPCGRNLICCCLVTKLCLTLCSPMDYSPPIGSSVHGIFQARILEWIAVSYSRGIFPTQGSNLSLLCCAVLSRFSRVWLFATIWTVALQAPLSHGILQARILEWVAVSFSIGSSWPRDRTLISCIGEQILYHWATWEAQGSLCCLSNHLYCSRTIRNTSFPVSIFKKQKSYFEVGKITRAADLKLRLLESSQKQMMMMTWDKLLSHEFWKKQMAPQWGQLSPTTLEHNCLGFLSPMPFMFLLCYLHHFLIFLFFISFRTSRIMSFLLLSISALLLSSSFIYSCALFFHICPIPQLLWPLHHKQEHVRC